MHPQISLFYCKCVWCSKLFKFFVFHKTHALTKVFLKKKRSGFLCVSKNKHNIFILFTFKLYECLSSLKLECDSERNNRPTGNIAHFCRNSYNLSERRRPSYQIQNILIEYILFINDFHFFSTHVLNLNILSSFSLFISM